MSHSPDPSLAERDLRLMRTLAHLIEDHRERQEIEKRLREGLGIEMTRTSAELRMALAKLDASRAETVLRLSRALDYRDDDSGAHTERVGRRPEQLSRATGLPAASSESILLASPLHDAGKVAIPGGVLLKPGRLAMEERSVMESHAEIGYELLRNSTSEVLGLAATIAWTHHERFDGNDYPRGLSGAEIPIEGRVVTIVDVYDALTHDRVYRPAFSGKKAIEIMREEAGHFDPDLLDVFIEQVLTKSTS